MRVHLKYGRERTMPDKKIIFINNSDKFRKNATFAFSEILSIN